MESSSPWLRKYICVRYGVRNPEKTHRCVTDRHDLTSAVKMASTLSQTTNFRLSQSEAFADDIFKFNKNGRKFSKQAENTVGKGEIAR